MSTRRFEAATTPAALRAVRSAFGEDAFILSNRRTDRGVEIIASRTAMEEPPEPAFAADADEDRRMDEGAPRTTRISIESLAAMSSAPGQQPAPAPARDVDECDVATEPVAPAPAPAPATGTAVAAAAAAPADEETPDVASSAVIDPSVIDEAVRAAVEASLAALLPTLSIPAAAAGTTAHPAPTVADAPTDAGAADGADSADVRVTQAGVATAPGNTPVADELATGSSTVGAIDIAAEAKRVAVATAASLNRKVDARLQRIEVSLWGRDDKRRAHLLDRLLRLGLGAPTAVRLAEQARGEDIMAMMRDVLARLRNSLPILRKAEKDAHDVLGVKLLSGPDSDARLTSLLQFARAAIALEGAASVVLVSADTGRTGAFSMLEECARELGCVAVRVRDLDTLESTLLSLSDRACVLVDAGHAWPALATPHQRLLVLPATLQRGACSTAIEAAREGDADGCLLCALQSAGRPGESLEALIEHWLPIAFWSDSDKLDVVPQRAKAAVVLAAAIGAARRLGSSEHDRLLGALMHPGQLSEGKGFCGAVRISCETEEPQAERHVGRPPGEPLGGVPMKLLPHHPGDEATFSRTASAYGSDDSAGGPSRPPSGAGSVATPFNAGGAI